jgi:hypothetical protein
MAHPFPSSVDLKHRRSTWPASGFSTPVSGYPDCMDDEGRRRSLAIYLRDHYAGSAGGLALARRAARNADDPERAAMWNGLADEIEDDRASLAGLMSSLPTGRPHLKILGARLGELAGRLKLNGGLARRTRLGQLVELEAMYLGVTGKLELWRLLASISESRFDGFDFGSLITRAESQRDRLEVFRINLADEVFGRPEREARAGQPMP